MTDRLPASPTAPASSLEDRIGRQTIASWAVMNHASPEFGCLVDAEANLVLSPSTRADLMRVFAPGPCVALVDSETLADQVIVMLVITHGTPDFWIYASWMDVTSGMDLTLFVMKDDLAPGRAPPREKIWTRGGMLDPQAVSD